MHHSIDTFRFVYSRRSYYFLGVSKNKACTSMVNVEVATVLAWLVYTFNFVRWWCLVPSHWSRQWTSFSKCISWLKFTASLPSVHTCKLNTPVWGYCQLPNKPMCNRWLRTPPSCYVTAFRHYEVVFGLCHDNYQHTLMIVLTAAITCKRGNSCLYRKLTNM